MHWIRQRKAMMLMVLGLLTSGIAQSDDSGNANRQAPVLQESGALLSYDRAAGHYRLYLAGNIGPAASPGNGHYPAGTGTSN